MGNLLRTIGLSIAGIGTINLNECISAESKFYQERISGYAEITPEIRAEAREYAEKEAYEQFPSWKRGLMLGLTSLGFGLAVIPYGAPRKKKEERSVESVLRDGLPSA